MSRVERGWKVVCELGFRTVIDPRSRPLTFQPLRGTIKRAESRRVWMEEVRRGWKVVRTEYDTSCSETFWSATGGSGSVQYVPNEWAKRPQRAGKIYGPLCVFESEACAKAFVGDTACWDLDTVEVFECDYVPSKDIGVWLISSLGGQIFYWCDLPLGTMLADEVMIFPREEIPKEEPESDEDRFDDPEEIRPDAEVREEAPYDEEGETPSRVVQEDRTGDGGREHDALRDRTEVEACSDCNDI